MITELVKQWEENKHKLEEYFKTRRQDEYKSYETIVKKVFELCIPKATTDRGWDLDEMTVIDDGDFQGTQIFIVPTDTYQPKIECYVMTYTYYGSSCACDTLHSINQYDYDFPTYEQVKEYMTLALHLVQKLKWLGTE